MINQLSTFEFAMLAISSTSGACILLHAIFFKTKVSKAPISAIPTVSAFFMIDANGDTVLVKNTANGVRSYIVEKRTVQEVRKTA